MNSEGTDRLLFRRAVCPGLRAGGILRVRNPTMGGRREAFEARFGALGSGSRLLVVGDQAFTLAELMERLGLAAEGCRSIDARELGADRFVIRFLDAEEQRIVAYEFDRHFRYLVETRIHVAEWIGEDDGP